MAICAIDAVCDADALTFKDRRDEEDTLSATVYPDLPYPESQLVSLVSCNFAVFTFVDPPCLIGLWS